MSIHQHAFARMASMVCLENNNFGKVREWHNCKYPNLTSCHQVALSPSSVGIHQDVNGKCKIICWMSPWFHHYSLQNCVFSHLYGVGLCHSWRGSQNQEPKHQVLEECAHVTCPQPPHPDRNARHEQPQGKLEFSYFYRFVWLFMFLIFRFFIFMFVNIKIYISL